MTDSCPMPMPYGTPAVRPDQDPDATASGALAERAAARTRVLVVDDNAMFIEMTQFVLSSAGYAVETAGDAGQALLQIPAFLPDLILMDIQMPGVDGMSLTRRLKADLATRHIVIVAFTAYAAKGDALGLREAGFDGYIAKPLDVMTLAAEVRFWLEGPATARGSPFVWP